MQRMGRTVRKVFTAAGAAAAVALLASPAAAQEPAAADTLQVHVVRPGDTLWDIARRYLSDPFRWTEIYRLNRGEIVNPHLIYPTERVRIPLLARAVPGGAPDRGEEADAAPMGPPERTVFFQPEGPTAAEHMLRLAEESPGAVVTRGDYLRAAVLLPEGAISPVGRLAELEAPSVVPVAMPPQIQLYDRVYMTLSRPEAVRVGTRLQLVREGRRIRPHGRVFQTTGLASVTEIEGAVAVVVVEEMYDVVAVGDAALPLPDFSPRPGVQPLGGAGAALEGTIIAFQTPHALQSVEDVAFVDLGSASGVTEGDELVALLPREARGWGTRPVIEVARLRVVRTTDRTAAARVIGLEQPALEPGLRVRLVAKMP